MRNWARPYAEALPRINLQATVGSRSLAGNYLSKPNDAVIVARQEVRWLILICPCGCGSQIPINLDPRAGPAWRLYKGHNGLSVYPSIWRDTDCKSHFIIFRNRILMLSSRDNDLSRLWDIKSSENMDKKVLAELSTSKFLRCDEIADRIGKDIIPWDVFRCCRRLCRKGLAIEGRGMAAGSFIQKTSKARAFWNV